MVKDAFKTKHKKHEAITKAVSALILFTAIIFTLYLSAPVHSEENPLLFTVISILSIVVVLNLFSMLKKQVRLEFQGKILTIVHRLTGNERSFELSQLDGYRTREYESRSGLIREFILVKDNKYLQIISSANVTNFDQLTEHVCSKLTNLGQEEKSLKNWLFKNLIG
ncbi:hypothetical protein [Fulvivirga lutea]|uniref:Uncharacterized protein n=1 Tax=Fulvivirga lutea TaxID=2810512 RepID=A0A974WGF4_9BACT|nr:hypothetical protein [Fulvivirga lutea]QSE98038.1 hypothetical protein JR347_02855 [Fulvivirga lutea]